jgi:hypothetical protein
MSFHERCLRREEEGQEKEEKEERLRASTTVSL